jgi:RNA polymerase sigma factor (sigma-70 family)
MTGWVRSRKLLDNQEENTFSTERILDDASLARHVLKIARVVAWKLNISTDAAEDLQQRSLLRYYELPEAKRIQINNPKAYLNRIIKNEAINFLREQNPDSVIPSDNLEDTFDALQTPDYYERIELNILLHEVWDKLEGEDRLLFELQMLDYRGNELALRLGVSPQTARQRVSRLRGKLKEILNES